MRSAVILCCCLFVLSCNESNETECPKIWDFDRAQITSNAFIESSELVLELFHPETPNAIELNQTGLVGDFTVSVSLNELVADTLITPQFRMEVLSEEGAPETVSGIAVNPKAIYCYVGGEYPEKGEMRLIPNASGSLTIQRLADTVFCVAGFGDVELTYRDVLPAENAMVRLVFGATSSGAGRVAVRLDDFVAEPMPSASDFPVKNDDFSCTSW